MGADALGVVLLLSLISPQPAQGATPVIPQTPQIVQDTVEFVDPPVQKSIVKPVVKKVTPAANVAKVTNVTKIADFIQNCESSSNPNAVNWDDAKITGYPSRGLFQFQQKTFNGFAKQYGFVGLSWLNPKHQRLVAEKMIAAGIAKNHWTICYGKYVRSLA